MTSFTRTLAAVFPILLMLTSTAGLKNKRFVLEDDLLESVKQLAARITALEANQGAGGTYVRWGRTTCPGNGTDLIYSGYVGGSHYTHSGAAVDYLCLPKDPIYDHYKDGLQDGGRVYGGEYGFNYHANGGANFFGQPLHDHDVPCAVCAPHRSRILMIPGRNACYPGWTLEYKGYLNTGFYTHAAASQFVCLDATPETIVGGAADENGKLFYLVEGVCGSLECPPYVQGRELTCAVCSK